ncbi:MAG: GNAT family N-acetyltransferase [Maritimibacter sp.]
MSNFAITAAGEDDLPELLKLYAYLHPNDPAPSPEQACAALAATNRISGSAVLIARKNGVMVASVTLHILPNLTSGVAPYGLIENVITHPAHRQQGHGTTLLRKAADRSQAEGCYKVMLMTGSQDPATLRFYEQAGFEQSKTGFQIRHR